MRRRLLRRLLALNEIAKKERRKSKRAMEISRWIVAVLGGVSLQNFSVVSKRETSVLFGACLGRFFGFPVSFLLVDELGLSVVENGSLRAGIDVKDGLAVREVLLGLDHLGMIVIVLVAAERFFDVALQDAALLLCVLLIQGADASFDVQLLGRIFLNHRSAVALVFGRRDARFDFREELIAEHGEGEGGVGVELSEETKVGLCFVDESRSRDKLMARFKRNKEAGEMAVAALHLRFLGRSAPQNLSLSLQVKLLLLLLLLLLMMTRRSGG